MNIHEAVASQYSASLKMMERAIELCPDSLWTAPEYPNRFWHIAFHALLCTHLYMAESHEKFQPWAKHRTECRALGKVAYDGLTPYSKAEVLEYLALCREEAMRGAAGFDPEAPSGFHWLPFNKLELQFYNLRHLQHHTGQLMDRLRSAAGLGVDWVRMGEDCA